jgi:hypothetical protein
MDSLTYASLKRNHIKWFIQGGDSVNTKRILNSEMKALQQKERVVKIRKLGKKLDNL